MPAMMVWPVSWFVDTRNVGSSSASFCSATPILSCSAFVFGSTAMSMTGSANSMDSRMMGCFSSQSVSPVDTSFRPTTATMSPAWQASMSTRWFECICRRRPMRSFLSFDAFMM